MHRLLSLLFLSTLAAGAAGARTWTVASDGTGDFQNIQDAINAAGFGDVIEVYPGVYHGAINTWGAVISLVGVDGAEATVVDADRQGAALTVPFSPGGELVVRGLTFRDGIGKILRDGTRDGRFGGGVFVEVAMARFEDCAFVDNDANVGGGIYVLSGRPEFIRCEISGNRAGTGGGIALEHDGGVRLKECRIVGNEAVFGGGLSLYHSLLVMDACEVRENTAAEGGAARLLERGPGVVWIRDSMLIDNWAGEGGSLQIIDADLSIVGSTIARNTHLPEFANVELVNADLRLATTIVETDSEGELMTCHGGAAQLDCVVLWSPSAEPADCIEGERFLFVDPLFCDPDDGVYRLRPDSPCLPGQGPSDCERIGAMGRCPVPSQRVETDLGGLRKIFR